MTFHLCNYQTTFQGNCFFFSFNNQNKIGLLYVIKKVKYISSLSKIFRLYKIKVLKKFIAFYYFKLQYSCTDIFLVQV